MPIVQFINHEFVNPNNDGLALGLSSWWTWFMAASVIYMVLIIRDKKQAIMVMLVALVALGVSDAICAYILKPVFSRLRPCKEYEQMIRQIAGCASWYGFPSNHASNAMAVTAVIWRLGSSNAGIVASCLAIGIGWSRIYLGVHYPTDVIGGYFFGGTVGFLVARLFKKI